MNKCPYCNKKCMPIWQKLILGPALPTKCRNCGKGVGVPYWSIVYVLPFIIVISTIPLLNNIKIIALSFIVTFILVSIAWIKFVPLIPRKKHPFKDFDNLALFWKLYFLFLLYIYITGLLSLHYKLGIWHFIDLIVSLPSLVAIFGLGFKKKLFVKFYWKTYFYFFLIWHFIVNYWLVPSTSSLFAVVLIGIAYIGLYLYAFKFIKKTAIKDKLEKRLEKWITIILFTIIVFILIIFAIIFFNKKNDCGVIIAGLEENSPLKDKNILNKNINSINGIEIKNVDQMFDVLNSLGTEEIEIIIAGEIFNVKHHYNIKDNITTLGFFISEGTCPN